MFDYSERIESFRDKKVRLSAELLDKLFATGRRTGIA